MLNTTVTLLRNEVYDSWFQCQNLFIILLYIYIIYIFASPQARQGRGTSSGPVPR